MIQIRHANDRGRTKIAWLDSRHTFSFGDYYDPANSRFRALRVMNEDWVAPGQGFGMHGHNDMEIVTIVLSGSLAHQDSLGNGEILRPGELQRMTAGTGIRHSEFNPSPKETTHLYQIWLLPSQKGLTPGYEQRPFPADARKGRWQVVAAPDGRDGALFIHQDATLSLATLNDRESVSYEFAPGRHGWLQVLKGSISLQNQPVEAGDGVAISDESRFDLQATSPAELLLFDLA